MDLEIEKRGEIRERKRAILKLLRVFLKDRVKLTINFLSISNIFLFEEEHAVIFHFPSLVFYHKVDDDDDAIVSRFSRSMHVYEKHRNPYRL